MARIRVGKRVFRLPRSRAVRIVLGGALVLGGVLGFLPILGFWMIPIGLAVLSVDLPFVRRLRRRAEIWWLRLRQSRRRRKSAVRGKK